MATKLSQAGLTKELDQRVRRAKKHVLIASPFLGRAVASLISRTAARERKLLTCYSEASIQEGYLSAAGLGRLLRAEFEIRSISNLHAKVILADEWAYVGSGNLTTAGVNQGNVELGVTLTGKAMIGAVLQWFNDLWSEADTRDARIVDTPALRRLEHSEMTRRRRRAKPEEPEPPGAVRGAPASPRGGRDTELLTQADWPYRVRRATLLLARQFKDPDERKSGDRVKRTAAYYACHLLAVRSGADGAIRNDACATLLRVLASHVDHSARAHAAFRLGNDYRPTREIEGALRVAARTDPSQAVVRAARRALAPNAKKT